MKQKFITFLLAMTTVLVCLYPGTQAKAVEPPKMPLFLMKATADVKSELTEGEEFTVKIYGEPRNAQKDNMVSFQFTLNYPKDELELSSMELAGAMAYVGNFDENYKEATFVYNAGTKDGFSLSKGGTLLCTVSFKVKPTKADSSFKISLKDAEITRPQDKYGRPVDTQQTDTIKIHHIPMISIPKTGSTADKTVDVSFHKNPKGTLVAAVYGEGGRMLRCKAESNIPANAGTRKVEIDMSKGKYVQMYFIDANYVPQCEIARMTLK